MGTLVQGDLDEKRMEALGTSKELILIDLARLEASPYNSYEVTDVEDMVRSIETFGLITPLTVIKDEKNGKYQILSGHRRYTAISKITEKENYNGEFKKVPCYVLGNTDMPEWNQKIIIEIANLETRESSMGDRDEHRINVMRILLDRHKAGDISHNDIIKQMVEYTCLSERYARMYRAIVEEGDENIIEMVKDCRLQVHEASRIAHQPKKVQEAIVKVMNDEKNKVNTKDILNVITEQNQMKKEIEKKGKEKNEKEKEAAARKEEAVSKKTDNKATQNEEEISTTINTTESDEISRIADDYENSFGKNDTDASEDKYAGMFADSDDDSLDLDELDDEEYIKAVGNGDIAVEKIIGLVERNNITQDTTGLIGGLSVGSSSKIKTKNKELGAIHSWVDNIFNRIEGSKKFTDEEYELFDRLADMLETVNNMDM